MQIQGCLTQVKGCFIVPLAAGRAISTVDKTLTEPGTRDPCRVIIPCDRRWTLDSAPLQDHRSRLMPSALKCFSCPTQQNVHQTLS